MKDFKKYYFLPATPDEVYLALTNPLTIQLWSGQPATMSTTPGEEFSWFDGSIVGKNLEFEEGKMVVQQWYFGDESENSIVSIKLHHKKEGTSMEVRHTNIPDQDYENIAEGWEEHIYAELLDFYE